MSLDLDTRTLPPGLHRTISWDGYLALDAIGSSELDRLAISPLHYRWTMNAPREETDATALGTALHSMLLEPREFGMTHCCEPDPDELAPDARVPRATKAYKEAVTALTDVGMRVMRTDAWRAVHAMKDSILAHRHARKLLERAPERELTLLWDRDGRSCRGRADALGDSLLVDVKTTRSLKTFSPFAITNMGYYRQAGWYVDGLNRLGREIGHVFFIAIENTPPFDVGVFALDPGAVLAGQMECTRLLELLSECMATGTWPGMFPEIQPGMLSDAAASQLAALDEEIG
jgi:exodeoxyribonuclease VIII